MVTMAAVGSATKAELFFVRLDSDNAPAKVRQHHLCTDFLQPNKEEAKKKKKVVVRKN